MMKFRNGLFFIIILIIATVIYFLVVHDKFYTVIEGRIYRSAQLSGQRLENIIKEKGINTIVNLRGKDKDEKWYEEEKRIAREYNVDIISIRLPSDRLPDYVRLNHLFNALLTAKRPLLLHCWRGSDRSGLASAMALIIEKNAELPLAKKQFSWRYGVFPFFDSIGTLVFSEYEKWLEKEGKQHSRDLFYTWFRNQYRDESGNIAYYIDSAQGKRFGNDSRSRVMIQRNENTLVIKGWAMDAKTFKIIENLYLSIDDNISQPLTYQYDRPDVAQYVGLVNPNSAFKVGWSAEFNTAGMADGCHKIFLKRLGKGENSAEIETDFQICIR
jgi:protein tyrosine phosphatase (PTP) superfamily phosphohydrolase (DUF442 family)